MRRLRMQDTGCRIQEKRCRMQDTGYRIQDTGCMVPWLVIYKSQGGQDSEYRRARWV